MVLGLLSIAIIEVPYAYFVMVPVEIPTRDGNEHETLPLVSKIKFL